MSYTYFNFGESIDEEPISEETPGLMAAIMKRPSFKESSKGLSAEEKIKKAEGIAYAIGRKQGGLSDAQMHSRAAKAKKSGKCPTGGHVAHTSHAKLKATIHKKKFVPKGKAVAKGSAAKPTAKKKVKIRAASSSI